MFSMDFPKTMSQNPDSKDPLFRLHHIGHLVKDLKVAADDYVARFGYSLESSIIEDPVQTARVLFLHHPGATCWIELVTPTGPDSKLKNALRKGVTLHHLCYEVDNIYVGCEYLREKKMFLISTPVTGVAFPGRQIAWLMDRRGSLIELLESGKINLSLSLNSLI